MPKILKKILKVIGYIIGGILLLLILIALLLQTPPVQNFVKDKAVSFLKDKIQTEFSIGKFDLDFPYDVVLKDVYLEDQQEDTLAYVQRVRVAAQMWGLFKGQLSISEVDVDGLVAYISTNEQDSTFNFQFVADAFAPADTTAVDTTQASGGMSISIDRVQVDNSRFYYNDPVSGIDMNYGIGDLAIEISEFDLEQSAFGISSISLRDSYGDFTILKDVPSTDEETGPVEFDLQVDDVTIAEVRFSFESIPDEMKLYTRVGELEGQMEKIDIAQMDYFADELALRNSLVEIDMYGEAVTDSLEEDQETTEPDTTTLNVGANLVAFEDVRFMFDDHSAPEASGFDPMHFGFSDLHARVEDPNYILDGDEMYASGEVASLTVEEEAGMVINKFNGKIEMTPEELTAKDIDLIAGESEIHGDFGMDYESLETIAENLADLGLAIDLAPSVIHLNDVVYFVPDLKEQIYQTLQPKARVIRLEGEVYGELSSLTIDYFQLKGLKNTNIAVEGKIAGMPDINNLKADLTIEEFASTRSDIQAIVPDTLLPENITIPEKLNITGQIAGSMEQAEANLDIRTSMGNADIDATISMTEDSVYKYNGKLAIDEFNVGKLLQQEEQFGKLTATIEADGRGFTLEEIETQLTSQIQSFTYNNYTYNDIKINGEILKQGFPGDLTIEDENLNLTFNGKVNLSDSIPLFNFDLEINKADLQALNFVQEDIRLRADIESNLRASDLRNINGNLLIEDVVIYKNNERYAVDSLAFLSIQQGRDTELTLQSDLLYAHFEGEFEVMDLPQVITAHINQYYDITDTTSLKGIEPQSFSFRIDIKKTDLITEVLVPDLESFNPGIIKGTYDSEDWNMDILIRMPEINYAGTIIDSLKITLKSDAEELVYDARVTSLHAGGITVENIGLEGLVANNHINTAFHIQNDQGENKYLFGGIFTSWQEQYYQLQLTPGRVVMDYKNWDVYPGNSIYFYPSGLVIEDVTLTHNQQELTAETTIEEQDTILNVGFQNFKLSTLGSIGALDTSYVSGLVNGAVDFNMTAETTAFTSDLSIRNIAYRADTLGNLSVNAYTTGEEKYNVTASLDGQASDLLIEGYYMADSVNDVINFDVDLQPLALTALEPFAMEAIDESRGFITADMAIRGTVEDPDIRGTLGFEEAMTKINYLGTFLLIDNEQITFDNRGVHIRNFVINDASGNDMIIEGDILTDTYSLFDFDLQVTMNNFLMVNTGAGDNPLFYGTLMVDSDIVVEGNSELPIVTMDVDLNDESRLTYIVPESEISTIEREGLIEFVDKSEQKMIAGDSLLTEGDSLLAEGDNEPLEDNEVPDSLDMNVQGIDLTANIDVDETNSFTVVIDPATGDRLSNLRGNASLAFSLNPRGDMSLNGRYTVVEGKYTMNFFGLAKREFNIVEGSYLLWTGDPLNARMDLRASYDVFTTPAPILPAQEFAPKREFLVYLLLEGQLLSPEIAFELSMPEAEQRSDIMAALQEINTQEGELIEQVLSLVVFRRFMEDNLLEGGGGGGGAEGIARQSVSRLLSQQLNQLTSGIKGVDLSFDVQSYQDYSQTGETFNRTEVSLGLEKGFFDDRVNVKVAGNYDVEGADQREQNDLSAFGGDVIIEYLITEDGRFKLIAFRKNEYDDLFQGEVVETGAGVIYVKEYDHISEIFDDLRN